MASTGVVFMKSGQNQGYNSYFFIIFYKITHKIQAVN